MEYLDNLAKVHELHKEPPDKAEFDGMLRAAKINSTMLKIIVTCMIKINQY